MLRSRQRAFPGPWITLRQRVQCLHAARSSSVGCGSWHSSSHFRLCPARRALSCASSSDIPPHRPRGRLAGAHCSLLCASSSIARVSSGVGCAQRGRGGGGSAPRPHCTLVFQCCCRHARRVRRVTHRCHRQRCGQQQCYACSCKFSSLESAGRQDRGAATGTLRDAADAPSCCPKASKAGQRSIGVSSVGTAEFQAERNIRGCHACNKCLQMVSYSRLESSSIVALQHLNLDLIKVVQACVFNGFLCGSVSHDISTMPPLSSDVRVSLAQQPAPSSMVLP